MYDVWFARNGGGFLYYALAKPGEPPFCLFPVKNAALAYKNLRLRGIKIAQVGITDSRMLGLT